MRANTRGVGNCDMQNLGCKGYMGTSGGFKLKLNPTPQIETEPCRFELTDFKIVGASRRRVWGLGFRAVRALRLLDELRFRCRV